jgi:hypothetical protein
MVLIENQEYLCEEEKRLKQDRERTAYWKKWGTYVAERQWATGMFPCSTALTAHANILQFAKTTRESKQSILHLHLLTPLQP